MKRIEATMRLLIGILSPSLDHHRHKNHGRRITNLRNKERNFVSSLSSGCRNGWWGYSERTWSRWWRRSIKFPDFREILMMIMLESRSCTSHLMMVMMTVHVAGISFEIRWKIEALFWGWFCGSIIKIRSGLLQGHLGHLNILGVTCHGIFHGWIPIWSSHRSEIKASSHCSHLVTSAHNDDRRSFHSFDHPENRKSKT